MKKERIDVLLVEQGFFDSREKAKRAIMAGIVHDDYDIIDKPGTKIPIDSNLHVKGNIMPYVSRGGLKLEKALKEFSLDIKDKIMVDIGSSTGGFTDCALQNGAKLVYAVDVGTNQLVWKLRNDYDMVIGHRNKREDGISRVFVTKVLKLVIKVAFKESVVDANTPFRLMNRVSLEDCMSLIPEDFNLSNVVLSVVYQKKNYKVKYLPVTFRPRQGGVNSINLKKISGIGKKALKDFKSINKSFKEAGL